MNHPKLNSQWQKLLSKPCLSILFYKNWIAAVRNAEGYSLQQTGLLSGIRSICLVTVLRSRSIKLDPWLCSPGTRDRQQDSTWAGVQAGPTSHPSVIPARQRVAVLVVGDLWAHTLPVTGSHWWLFLLPGADCWRTSWEFHHCREFCLCHPRKLNSSKRQSHLTVPLKKCSQVKRVNRGNSGQLPAAELLIKTMEKCQTSSVFFSN